jgi:hypothetical protein
MSTMSTDAKKLEKMVAKEAKGDEKVYWLDPRSHTIH